VTISEPTPPPVTSSSGGAPPPEEEMSLTVAALRAELQNEEPFTTNLRFEGKPGEDFARFRRAAEYQLDDVADAKKPRALNKMLGERAINALANARPQDGYTTMIQRWTALSQAFGSNNRAMQAAMQYSDFKRKGLPLDEFIDMFDTYTSALDLSEAQKARDFIAKQTEGMKTKLLLTGKTSYADLKDMAWLLDDSVQKEYQRNKKLREATQGKPQGRRYEGRATRLGERDIECWNCHKKGHISLNCPEPQVEWKPKPRRAKPDNITTCDSKNS